DQGHRGSGGAVHEPRAGAARDHRSEHRWTGTVTDYATGTHTLQQFPEKLVVARLAPGAEVPDWAESSSLFSVTATAKETSIVCAGRSVPKKVPQAGTVTAVAVE